MVTCNICGKNKKLEDIQGSFKYVCKECWGKMEIRIDEVTIDKDIIY